MFKNIVSWFWRLFYREWTDDEVKAFWDKFPDINTLSSYLFANGFSWGSDGLNISYYTDTEETPNQILGRRFANCNGWARFFEEYVYYKKPNNIDSVYRFLLYNDSAKLKGWHVINLFISVKDNLIYIQSNMNVNIINLNLDKLEDIVRAFFPNYKKIELKYVKLIR